MKEVLISMHSSHGYDNHNRDAVDFTTDGIYSFDNGIGQMSYMETEVTGLIGTRTSVSVSPTEVVVDRSGSINSRMVFREGKSDSFLYETPFGIATLGLDTRRIKQNFNESGGSVEIDYVVNVDRALVSRNTFKIKVREMGGQNGEQTYG